MIDHRLRLREMADDGIAKFNKKLIPGCGSVLGVRIPMIRTLAKEIIKDDWQKFLDDADEDHLEHVILQGLVICNAAMDLKERLGYLTGFVQKIDNWAACDSCQYKAKRTEREEYWKFVQTLVEEPDEFKMRYGVIAMLTNFIDDDHINEVLDIIERIEHPGYYLKMGVAWTVSVCFVKFPERTMSFLKDCELDDFTYNRSLQKIIESYRVDDSMKKIIRSMKRKR